MTKIASIKDIEAKIGEIVDGCLKSDVMEEVFKDFMIPKKKDRNAQLRSCKDQIMHIFKLETLDEKNKCVNLIIQVIHKEKSNKKVKFLFEVLEYMMLEDIFPYKTVLDRLQCADLSYQKKFLWCETYGVIKRHISRLDYKGCRDILKSMIVKTADIPKSDWPIYEKQIEVFCDVLNYILDPDSQLMPGYLAISEIRRHMPDDLHVPWVVQGNLMRFIDRFRATVKVAMTTERWNLLPVVHHASSLLTSAWKLEPETLRFPLNRQLPYPKEMHQRQSKLFRHILKQGYSQDFVLQVLGVNKQSVNKSFPLEQELSEVLIETLLRDDCSNQFWQHLSALIIYFLFYQMANFPSVVDHLCQKLSGIESQRFQANRDKLCWALLQFISGSMQKSSLNDFLPAIKLIHILYPESEPLPVHELTKPLDVVHFSAISILFHLNRRFMSSHSTDGAGNMLSEIANTSIPRALETQNRYLYKLIQTEQPNRFTITPDFGLQHIALLCNACSTTPEIFHSTIPRLMENVCGDDCSPTIPLPGTNCEAYNKLNPLSVELLDSLTAHTKLSMLHHFVARIQNRKSKVHLSPAFVESYSRLLVYSEIESLGIEGLVNQVLPFLFEHKAWGRIYTLLEIICYRLHHIRPNYRLQLLSTLHSLASSSHANLNQLQQAIEGAALRLIMGFDNCDIKPQLECLINDKKQIVFKDSEELNRVLMLTMARSIHRTGAETISGSWCTEVLKAIMTATPHKWPVSTLHCFPATIQEYFRQHQVDLPDKTQLKSLVDSEFPRWKNILTNDQMASNEDQESSFAYFISPNSPPYFLCFIWKVLFDGSTPSQTAYKVLENMKASLMSEHVRVFSDFLIYEFASTSDGGSHLNHCADVLRDMVWKYNVVSLDRFILCLALRSSEHKDVQVAFFIIHYLLIKPDDFRTRVCHFVREVDDLDHWSHEDWYSQHISFHQKFPENYFFEGLLDHCSANPEDRQGTGKYLPSYFSNICLRFLPVLDIVIHRCVELLPTSNTSLEILIDHLGLLYKFHAQPITYLYNTLHYYEKKLRDQKKLKKKLVTAIFNAITEHKPPNWAFSRTFVDNVMKCPSHEMTWEPNAAYMCELIGRLVDTIDDDKVTPFATRDWRFNEFPNEAAHALHVTCVEILSLPLPSEKVGRAIMNVVLKRQPRVQVSELISWMNAIGLVLTSLPQVYWRPLHDIIVEVLKSPELSSTIPEGAGYPFPLFSFESKKATESDNYISRVVALTHIVWQHMRIGQLSLVPTFLKEELKSQVHSELQLLFVFHLIGPSYVRFHHERSRCLTEVTSFLYDILLEMNNHVEKIHFCNEISDFLYHIKYMHVGVMLNEKVKTIVDQLQMTLQSRLQFIHPSAAR